MDNLEQIVMSIDDELSRINDVREGALKSSRQVIHSSSRAIRAVHRQEWETAAAILDQAREGVEALNGRSREVPQVYWAGYVQDAQKEYAEANLTLALVRRQPLPTPQQLGVEAAAYLKGLAEAASELRRYILDLVRHSALDEADGLLETMEEVYSYLTTVDYPHAITNNLRRTTDTLRAVLERTRGDVTVAMKQQELKNALQSVEARLDGGRSTTA